MASIQQRPAGSLAERVLGGDLRALSRAITLIENDVLIGDVTLQAGSFLFTQESFVEESSIYHFTADEVGAGLAVEH